MTAGTNLPAAPSNRPEGNELATALQIRTNDTTEESALAHRPALDGLRGVAILAVLFYHLSEKRLPGGWAGVDLFFVLSGFLITSNLIREFNHSGRIDFLNFYMRRAIRLGPALLLLLSFVLVLAATIPDKRDVLVHEAVFTLIYVMNFVRAFDLSQTFILGHTWSLSIEEQYYLLWPLCFAAFAVHRPQLSLLLALFLVSTWRIWLVVAGAHGDRTYNGLDTHLDPILLGSLLAFIKVTPCVRAKIKETAWISALGLPIIFIAMPLYSPVAQTIGPLLTALLAAPIVLGSNADSRLNDLLSHRSITYVGKISYGLYLWHYPIFILGFTYFPKYTYLLMIPLAFLVAQLSFHFVEKPVQRLRMRFVTPARTKISIGKEKC